MRNVGCGLLMLAASLLPAVAQPPDKAPRQRYDVDKAPSPEEARNTSACDDTNWAKTVADIKAADPERDAEKQIAERSFSLRLAPGWVTREPPPQSKPSERLALRARNPYRLNSDLIMFSERLPQTVGVQCWLDVGAIEAFPAFDHQGGVAQYDLRNWCDAAVLFLRVDCASRFNQRMVRDLAFPHKDLCAAAHDKSNGGRPVSAPVRPITDQATPDLTPPTIPNLPTAARFGRAERVAKFIARWQRRCRSRPVRFRRPEMGGRVRDYRPVLDLVIAAGGKPDFCAALDAAVAYKRDVMVAQIAGRCAALASGRP